MANSKYLIPNKADHRWGITTRTVGLQDVPAGSSYPIGEHPDDYIFLTETGRVLREIQIIYITRGGGWFVSSHQPRTELRAGDAVVLYPGEWHNYAPHPETGWTEAWIGFSGQNAEKLIEQFFPDKTRPVHHIGLSEELISTLEKAHEVAEEQLPAYQQLLAGYVGLILSLVYAGERQLPYRDNPDRDGIMQAVKLMRQKLHTMLNMEDVALAAGMGYSKFRKLFKDYTGFSPAQYFLRLKMERAKDYLLGSGLSCKEIAFRLGYDSASYFNKTFRLYQKQTPMDFRAGKVKK